MPRPRSELTKNRRCVSMHMTPKQHGEWKRIGAQEWLRALLDALIEQNKRINEAVK